MRSERKVFRFGNLVGLLISHTIDEDIKIGLLDTFIFKSQLVYLFTSEDLLAYCKGPTYLSLDNDIIAPSTLNNNAKMSR